MKQADRTKVCWSCEADVNSHATYCPFCGTDLLTSKSDTPSETSKQDARFSSQSLQESLASLYKPPYSVRNRQGFGIPDEREEPSFPTVTPPKKETSHFNSYETSQPPALENVKEEAEIDRGTVLPLLLLTVGFSLITLAILVFFFSKGGLVRLELSSRYWLFYLLMGAGASYLGFRTLKHLTPKDH